MTIDRELQRLAWPPFSRAASIARVEQLLQRYTLALQLDDPAIPPQQQKTATMRLLYQHPSALLEQSSVTRAMLEGRLEAARSELLNLRAAAPLPPPSDRAERIIILAFADLEHLMREMRAVRRVLRRMPPDPLVAWYKTRKDQLDPLDANLVRSIGKIPRGGLLQAAAAIAGIRYNLPELRQLLVPARPKGPPAAKIHACAIKDVAEGCGKRVEAHGRAIALFKDHGALYAIDDICPHRGGPLHQGDVENGAAICPLHGWAFDLKTGAMRGNPRVTLPVYEVELRGDEVFVGGERDKK